MLIDLLVSNATLLDSEGNWDIGVRGSKIEFIRPHVAGSSTLPPEERVVQTIDAACSLVVAPFCDPHFHLDKVLSRQYFGATSPEEAFEHARDVKVKFTPDGVEARACQALELAAAHGTGAIRAQCDVDSYTDLVSLEGVLAARDRYKGIVDLQVVAFPQEGILSDPKTFELLRDAMRLGADLIGGLPEFEKDVDDQRSHLTKVFEIAEEFNAPIDMHIDYVDDPELGTLEMLADKTIERGYQGRVTADHCCALAVYPDDQAARVIEKVRAAEVGVAVMPMANLQMLGGPDRTPKNRGSSRLGELLDAGVNVAVGSDNMFDIWYRFNRMDPSELALITCLSGGLNTDDDVRLGFEMTNNRAATVMGLKQSAIAPGQVADFTILNATSIVDFMRNISGRRRLVRNGRVVAGLEGSYWVEAPQALHHN